MRLHDEKIEQQLQVKEQDDDLSEVPQWNRLSMNKDDPEFCEEVINDDNSPESDPVVDKSNNYYLNMEIGLPRGEGNQYMQP